MQHFSQETAAKENRCSYICIQFRMMQIQSPDPELKRSVCVTIHKLVQDVLTTSFSSMHVYKHVPLAALLLDSSTKPRPSTEIYFPGMKRSLRLRPQFLYETLSCILPTLSCLKDDPAWGWNMENKWKIQSRLTNCGWLLCQINRRQFCSTFQ